jgi:hypothetical protein
MVHARLLDVVAVAVAVARPRRLRLPIRHGDA